MRFNPGDRVRVTDHPEHEVRVIVQGKLGRVVPTSHPTAYVAVVMENGATHTSDRYEITHGTREQPFLFKESELEKVDDGAGDGFMVYYQNGDSYHSVPQLPVAIFTGENAEERAIEYAKNQNGYGYGADWFVKPVPVYN